MTTTTTGDAAGQAEAMAGMYAVQMTGAQLISFSSLVRRLIRADGPGSPLRDDLARALMDFDALLPDVSDEDGEAWLAARDAGRVTDWAADTRPLTAGN